MPATSSPQARRASLLALVTFAAVGLYAAEPACAQEAAGKPNEAVKLSVRISVTDKGGGSPVPGAKVTLRRQGRAPAGPALADRTMMTDAKGEASLTAVIFRLGGLPHKVVVTAEGFRTLELGLPDVVLREAAHIDGQLTIALSLAELNSRPRPSSENRPTPQAVEPEPSLFYQQRVWVIAAAVLTTLSIVVVFVAWGVWLRRRYRSQSSLDLATLNARLSLNSHEMRKLATREDIKTLTNRLTHVIEVLRDMNRAVKVESVAAAPPVERRAAVQRVPFKERAHLSYLKLAEGAMPDIDPLYAKADAKSTLFGKLADSNVYLLQEGHRQVAFVLFTEDGKQGWVFPNPTLVFRPGQLSAVFPELTEGEFESAKEQIEPARVARVDEVRWTVSRPSDRRLRD